MYRQLGSVALKSGEQMEIGVVRCPDPSWGAQVIPLLGHKSRETRDHFQRAFAGPLDDLDTRFYVGTIGGFAVTNVMIVGSRGAGILGHVFTRPEHRQKGAFTHLMRAQMDDVRRDGYRLLTLGTGFETHPYWIYHGFGFRSIDGVSGKMKWLADPGAERDLFRPAPSQVRPMRWDDWAWLNAACFQPAAPDEELPRSWVFRAKAQGGAAEGMFQQLQRNVSRNEPITALALQSDTGATVGWVVLQPDSLALGDGASCDLYVLPGFRAEAHRLLAEVPWPHSRVAAYTSYTSGPAGWRAAALRAAGFEPAARLPGWLRRDGEPVALDVLVRGPT
jgi:GNAT superfamily N-acetyltransferase